MSEESNSVEGDSDESKAEREAVKKPLKKVSFRRSLTKRKKSITPIQTKPLETIEEINEVNDSRPEEDGHAAYERAV